MKIAVTSKGNHLDAEVDPHFGRCAWFLIMDPETLELEALENPNLVLGGGAGIQSATLLAQHGVKHVLTGNCGPKAFQTLSAAGINIIVGCSGTIRQVATQFKAGTLSAVQQANVVSHFGIGGGRMGKGRGMSQGFSRITSSNGPANEVPTQAANNQEELAVLKKAAESLSQEMQKIKRRIEELSGK